MHGYACHETRIPRVVGSLVNQSLGCNDIKWSDTCLVISVILFTSVCSCALAPTANVTTDA